MIDRYQHIDLANARHLLLPNRYRIGDAVAVMTLRHWVDTNYGAKDWYLATPNATLATLSQFVAGKAWQWYGPEHTIDRTTGRRRDFIETFDDVNLWLWNDYFHWEGFRLDLTVPRMPMGAPRVLFAPLLEVDYAPERAMHIRFVVELCRAMAGEEGFAVLKPRRMNRRDEKMIRATGVDFVSAADTATLAVLIGNADVFIGGDTGTSHIAGTFPHVRQIALHDRLNTERHNETEFDHQREARMKIRQYLVSCPDDGPRYRSTPNKTTAHVIYFDHNGWDGKTLDETVATAHAMWSETTTNATAMPTFSAPMRSDEVGA
jgi:hypothetical protein